MVLPIIEQECPLKMSSTSKCVCIKTSKLSYDLTRFIVGFDSLHDYDYTCEHCQLETEETLTEIDVIVNMFEYELNLFKTRSRMIWVEEMIYEMLSILKDEACIEKDNMTRQADIQFRILALNEILEKCSKLELANVKCDRANNYYMIN
jgi:hypothetical protein